MSTQETYQNELAKAIATAAETGGICELIAPDGTPIWAAPYGESLVLWQIKSQVRISAIRTPDGNDRYRLKVC